MTPGLQVFIDRHAKRVLRVLSGTWQNPGTAITAPGSGTSGTGGPPGLSGSPPVAGESEPANTRCNCTCEELADFETRMVDAKKADIDEAMMTMTGPMMACTNQCQREYMIYRVEADEAEKRKEALLEKEKADKIRCDCSCESLDNLNSRARTFEKQLAPGGTISNEDILQLSHCATLCQQEMLSCAMKK